MGCWWRAPRQLQQTLRLITLQPNLAHSEKQFFKEKSFTFRFFFSVKFIFRGIIFFSVIRNFSSTNTTVITSNQEKTNFFPKKNPPTSSPHYELWTFLQSYELQQRKIKKGIIIIN